MNQASYVWLNQVHNSFCENGLQSELIDLFLDQVATELSDHINLIPDHTFTAKTLQFINILHYLNESGELILNNSSPILQKHDPYFAERLTNIIRDSLCPSSAHAHIRPIMFHFFHLTLSLMFRRFVKMNAVASENECGSRLNLSVNDFTWSNSHALYDQIYGGGARQKNTHNNQLDEVEENRAPPVDLRLIIHKMISLLKSPLIGLRQVAESVYAEFVTHFVRHMIGRLSLRKSLPTPICSPQQQQYQPVSQSAQQLKLEDLLTGLEDNKGEEEEEKKVDAMCNSTYEEKQCGADAYDFSLDAWDSLTQLVNVLLVDWTALVMPENTNNDNNNQQHQHQQQQHQPQPITVHQLHAMFLEHYSALIFEIVIGYPDSHVTLLALSRSLTWLPDKRDPLIAQVGLQIAARLLHQGVSTADLLSGYMCVVKALHVLDPTGHSQRIVCMTIAAYLKSRDDAIDHITRIVIGALENIAGEHHKEIRDELTLLENRPITAVPDALASMLSASGAPGMGLVGATAAPPIALADGGVPVGRTLNIIGGSNIINTAANMATTNTANINGGGGGGAFQAGGSQAAAVAAAATAAKSARITADNDLLPWKPKITQMQRAEMLQQQRERDPTAAHSQPHVNVSTISEREDDEWEPEQVEMTHGNHRSGSMSGSNTTAHTNTTSSTTNGTNRGGGGGNTLGKSSRLDLLSILFSIFGSKAVFAARYKRHLAERLLCSVDFDTSSQTRNLELLKLRFGQAATAANFADCEVMLRDVEVSKRDHVNINNGEIAAQFGVPLQMLLLSNQYWPLHNHPPHMMNHSLQPQEQQQLDIFELNLPENIRLSMQEFSRRYKANKQNRKLQSYTSLGCVRMQIQPPHEGAAPKLLELTPLQASIVDLFSQQPVWSLSGMAHKLSTSQGRVRDALGLLRSERIIEYHFVASSSAAAARQQQKQSYAGRQGNKKQAIMAGEETYRVYQGVATRDELENFENTDDFMVRDDTDEELEGDEDESSQKTVRAGECGGSDVTASSSSLAANSLAFSSAASRQKSQQQQQNSQAADAYWRYISSMLTNNGPMEETRILTMMSMFEQSIRMGWTPDMISQLLRDRLMEGALIFDYSTNKFQINK